MSTTTLPLEVTFTERARVEVSDGSLRRAEVRWLLEVWRDARGRLKVWAWKNGSLWCADEPLERLAAALLDGAESRAAIVRKVRQAVTGWR